MESLWKKLKRSLFDSFRSSKKSRPKNKIKKRSSSIRRKRKPIKKTAKKTVRKKRPKKSPPKKVKKQKVKKESDVYIGSVTHYFPKVHAGVIRIEKKPLKIGDTIRIQGDSTKMKQKVLSMQINRIPIEVAKPGEEIGIEVKKPVKQGDQVYKL